MGVRRGGKLDYGSTSALTHWPYLLNALQKQLWLVHREWCSEQASMCVCVCVSCELSLFHASHTGLRNNSLYYREEHTQCHLALVHIPAFRAPRKPNSHSQVIPFPFPPLWLDAVTNFASQKNVSGLPHTGIESVFFSPHYLRIMCF